MSESRHILYVQRMRRLLAFLTVEKLQKRGAACGLC
jgi:hypothetical protein